MKLQKSEKIIKLVCALVGVIFGIITIVFGVVLAVKTSSLGGDVEFGADFYTEIYSAVKDVEYGVYYLQGFLLTFCKFMLIAFGMFEIAFFGNKAVKVFFDKSAPITQSVSKESTEVNTVNTVNTVTEDDLSDELPEI